MVAIVETIDNSIKESQEVSRQKSVKDKLLYILRAYPNGITNKELSHNYNILRYGGTLGELYKDGYNIKTERFVGGLTKYTLLSEPTDKIERKTAIQVFCDHLNSKGANASIESIQKVFDEVGVTIKFKAGTYKKNERTDDKVLETSNI